MKLLYHFQKELVLQSRSWYFYVEIATALIILLVLQFVVPNNFDYSTKEYVYLDMPEQYRALFYDASLQDDLDGRAEEVTIKVDGKETAARLYKSENKEIYYVASDAIAKALAYQNQYFAAKVSLGSDGKMDYVYYTQGYESIRLKNLYLILHNDKVDVETLIDDIDNQTVIKIGEADKLSDKQYLIPLLLTLNGSYLAMFVIAAYIFLDKGEDTIKAFAVTPAPIWQYMLSKIAVLTISNIASSLLIVIPFIGLQANYLLLIVFIAFSGFLTMSIGLVIATYYDDMMQSFGTIFILMLALMPPVISYMVPSWQPALIKALPTYYMMESFKEIIVPDGDVGYVLMSGAALLALGLLLFGFANKRFEQTLTRQGGHYD